MRASVLFLLSASFLGLSTATFAQGVTPAAGELVVSEMMFNPGPDACVTDENGEWFEVTNVSTKALNLNGLAFTDVTTSTPTYFRVPPAFGLPTLYPGQRAVFCRKTNTAINGNITAVYGYVGTPVGDEVVTGGAMNMGNSGIDGIRIYTDVPPAFGGTGVLIEEASYNTGAAPLNSGGTSGISVERKNLFQSMVATSSPVANSTNLVKSTTQFGPCNPISLGTPNAENSQDTTPIWPSNSTFDSVNFPNTGVLTPKGPASVGAGTQRLLLSNGPATLSYYLGYSDNSPSETPISLFIPGNPGSIVLDLITAVYLAPAPFDGAGAADLTIPIPNVPALVNQTFLLQWLALDSSFVIVNSNGVAMTICE
ncbi:MAG: hypothetical protein JNJ88_00380 [Planctomycetes bacterium]|nr:hypothetical protein [Planctomycetota bacterium]